MLDFTVAIRIHNGERNIPKVLDQLLAQTNTENINWEIVVVDNNSSDNTANIIRDYQAKWSKKFPLRYYFEPQQGASVARQRAMEEAKGAWVGFLDDDNLPASDWVKNAYQFGKDNPQAGAYGGKIQAIFETEPPENFKKIAVFLAIIDRGNKAFCYNNHQKKVLPPGAGIVITKRAWEEAVPKKLILLGPNGKSLFTKGEDLEILSYIQQANWEIWYVPNMHISHYLPSWRLERDYLIKLVGNSGLSRYHIRTIRLKSWQKPLALFAYLVIDFYRLLIYFIKHFNSLKHDTITACEMRLLLSIFISPFYFWKQQMLNTVNASNHPK